METLKTATSEKSMWERVVDDPTFDDLPFKVETNEYDQIILTAYKLSHSVYQGRIADHVRELLQSEGILPVEFAIQTRKGVKVPDVAWMSDERLAKLPSDAELSPIAPEICVEVLSKSNSPEEINQKRELYFENGAEEVWTCDMNGAMTFYGPRGQISSSELVPDFPQKIAR